MQDHQLYEQLLGLVEPWYVQEVKLKIPEREVEVTVACRQETWACPECQERMHVHQWEERRWRHLDTCQFKTFLRAKVPVVWCSTHGAQTVRVPWAEKHGRFTTLFERFAIEVLLESSVSGACGILRISWDEADGIKQRAVKRGLARKEPEPVVHLGVDEKSAGAGHDYLTVVARIQAGQAATVEYVGDGRAQEALDGYWQAMSAEHRQQVEAVAMDLWDPYWQSTVAHLPGAEEKIVHDRYHLMKHLTQAVDTVRKREHRELLSQGDQRLAGTKYLWLYGRENVPPSREEEFNRLKGQRLKTSRAWAIKELFRDFWSCPTPSEAGEFFQQWYGWAIRSRLEPIKRVARMLRRHLKNILTFFTHRLSNAALEGLNNRIAGLVKKAFGYRNRERMKTDILFHLGGLDLFPAQ